MRKRVAIVGASGYAGAELTALLAAREDTEIVALYSSGRERTSFGALHPSLRGTSGPAVETFSVEAVCELGADAVFLATPNELSAAIAGPIVDSGSRVIDLSGAFRLRRAADYPHWYGFEHPRPDLLDEAVYGLTEHCSSEELRSARIIANPGCYPTATLLALKPLEAMLDRRQPLIVDAKSGVSGAGKKSDLAWSFAELSGNCKAYSVGTHRHTPEMKQALDLATYTPFIFTPHLLPTVRGIIATIYVAFLSPQNAGSLSAAYDEWYGDASMIDLFPAGSLPELRDVVGTPRAAIGFAPIDGGKRAVVVSVIDNLLKGAASQAVQNYDAMFAPAKAQFQPLSRIA